MITKCSTEKMKFTELNFKPQGAEKGNKTYFVSPNQAGVPTIVTPSK